MRLPLQKQVFGLVGLAVVFWILIFGFKVVNFWLGMALAASSLAGLSLHYGGWPLQRDDASAKNLLLGALSAPVLYALFWIGDATAASLFSFARPEVANIYQIREQGGLWVIALVLFFVTSPAEELFWRGFVQRWLMARLGPWRGLAAGAGVYGGVHVFSGNLMLTLAALTAGAFWGWLYLRTQSLSACILSHALWTVGIFVLWPI